MCERLFVLKPLNTSNNMLKDSRIFSDIYNLFLIEKKPVVELPQTCIAHWSFQDQKFLG